MNTGMVVSVGLSGGALVLVERFCHWRMRRRQRRIEKLLAGIPPRSEIIGSLKDWRGREIVAYREGTTHGGWRARAAGVPKGQETACCRWLDAEGVLDFKKDPTAGEPPPGAEK